MLTSEGFILISDTLGNDYTELITQIASINGDLTTLQNDQLANIGSSNPLGWQTADTQEAVAYFQLFKSMISTTGSAGLSVVGSPLGDNSPNGLASASNGFFQVGTCVKTAFNTFFSGFTANIYSFNTGSPSIVNIPTWLAANPSVQVSSAFANLYYQIYNSQLLPANVFAPTGLNIGSFVITGSDTGTLTAGYFPLVNGYSGHVTNGVYCANAPYYLGGQVAQGYAPCTQIKAHITTTINGTCALTVTAGHTFTATLDSATAGTDINLTMGGNTCALAATAIAVSGSATSGGFDIQAVKLR